jgi:hypothetical protein
MPRPPMPPMGGPPMPMGGPPMGGPPPQGGPPAPAPDDVMGPAPDDQGPPPGPMPDEAGQSRFDSNVEFRKKIEQGNYVPLWVEPRLAHQLLMDYGQSGAVLPHPNMDVNDMSK